jgi:hypothetical protein
MALVDAKWNPSVPELRQFGGMWLPAFLAVLGIVIGYHQQTGAITAGLLILTVLVCMLGLTWPSLFRPVFIVWMALFYPVGWTISHLLLVIVFFGVMAPVGLLLKLFGYDPMAREFDRSCKSYWVSHNPGGDAPRYFRQL